MIDPDTLPPDRPVLIAGPTASGKSALALAIAEARGGVIVNADALQVFANWRVLTARPPAADLARAPHALYGHVPGDADYSVGHWLRDLRPLLARRPIIVGGTGLYFTALTEGLADIPPVPPGIRTEANALPLADMLAALDPPTRDRIDGNNRARVQRAFEVLRSTGRGLAAWQQDTPTAAAAACRLHRADDRCPERLAQPPHRAAFRPDASPRRTRRGPRQPPRLGPPPDLPRGPSALRNSLPICAAR